MKMRWVVALVVAAAPFISVAETGDGSLETLGSRVTQSYISPAMTEFQHAAVNMEKALQGLCSNNDTREQTALAFEQLVKAWSAVEFLRFGPLVESNRFENIYFWPDPRGVMSRQVQAVLAKPAADIPDSRQLAAQSVALKGLPALEFVLYRDNGLLTSGSQSHGDSACVYSKALAGHLVALSTELADQWSQGGPQAALFTSPGPDNPLYRNPKEVASEIIKALSTGMQYQAEVKLAAALGPDSARASYRKAPYWRSGLSLIAIESAVRGMLAFYEAGNYQFGDAQWIDQNIRGEMQRAVEQLASLEVPVQQLFTSEAGHRDLTVVVLQLRNAKSLIDQDMAPALGVRIGFNALDGD
ncbi:MAG TPA: imelysin family protein [Pusillimonas sp.]|uniref:imelysin family protein n=1 Tax=unclassified Pusillimonas TaxID=2640016 RepID=UPI00260E19DC|nr:MULTISPECIES: imelysin family protein [unclassified Pusillimonas]HLU19506.1 imelysin family protein [Pusillimonas sp.]